MRRKSENRNPQAAPAVGCGKLAARGAGRGRTLLEARLRAWRQRPAGARTAMSASRLCRGEFRADRAVRAPAVGWLAWPQARPGAIKPDATGFFRPLLSRHRGIASAVKRLSAASRPPRWHRRAAPRPYPASPKPPPRRAPRRTKDGEVENHLWRAAARETLPRHPQRRAPSKLPEQRYPRAGAVAAARVKCVAGLPDGRPGGPPCQKSSTP